MWDLPIKFIIMVKYTLSSKIKNFSLGIKTNFWCPHDYNSHKVYGLVSYNSKNASPLHQYGPIIPIQVRTTQKKKVGKIKSMGGLGSKELSLMNLILISETSLEINAWTYHIGSLSYKVNFVQWKFFEGKVNWKLNFLGNHVYLL